MRHLIACTTSQALVKYWLMISNMYDTWASCPQWDGGSVMEPKWSQNGSPKKTTFLITFLPYFSLSEKWAENEPQKWQHFDNVLTTFLELFENDNVLTTFWQRFDNIFWKNIWEKMSWFWAENEQEIIPLGGLIYNAHSKQVRTVSFPDCIC